MSDSINTAIIQEINAVGLLCPLPILRFKKRVKFLPSGTVVEFFTDDPTGRKDLESLCNIAGHNIKEVDMLAQGGCSISCSIGVEVIFISN